MKYAIYNGNPRLKPQKAEKLTEVRTLDEAIKRLNIERTVHGRNAYIVEV